MKSNRFCAIGVATVLMLVTPCLADIEATGDVSPAGPATWDNTTSASIGSSAVGTLSVTNGSKIVTREVTTYNGTVLVDGLGSEWLIDSDFVFGPDGNGNSAVHITGGGLVTMGPDGNRFGRTDISSGSVFVDGANSRLTNTNELVVGQNGHGELTITNGGVVTSNAAFISFGGYSGTGAATVDGAGSLWTTGGGVLCRRNRSWRADYHQWRSGGQQR